VFPQYRIPKIAFTNIHMKVPHMPIKLHAFGTAFQIKQDSPAVMVAKDSPSVKELRIL
jgi:hypothetical protein